EPAGDAGQTTVVELRVVDRVRGGGVHRAGEADRLVQAQPRPLGGNEQSVHRLVRHVHRVARVVEPVADQVAEVGAVRLALVDGGVPATVRADGDAGGGEALPRAYPRHRQRGEVGQPGALRGVHRDAQP